MSGKSYRLGQGSEPKAIQPPTSTLTMEGIPHEAFMGILAIRMKALTKGLLKFAEFQIIM